MAGLTFKENIVGWIGVDLDGTLARYDGWNGGKIGSPIQPMVDRVKRWLAEGREVRIVTARVGRPDPTRVSNTPEKIEAMRKEIENWCEEHIGQRLVVTNEKDYGMSELWDDRAVQVETNTGRCIRHHRTEGGKKQMDKRCFGKLKISLNMCDECPVRAKCVMAIFEDASWMFGICGICEHLKTIQGASVCITEQPDKEGDIVTTVNSLKPGLKVFGCHLFEESWDSDEADQEEGEEYEKMIARVFGPNSDLYV